MFNFGSVKLWKSFCWLDYFLKWFQDGIFLGQGFFQQRFQGTILINGLCLTSRVNDSTLGWVLYQNGWSLPSLMSDEISSKHWFSRVNSLLVLQRVEATEVFQVFLVPIISGDLCGRSYISPKLILNIPIDNKPELGVVFQSLGNGSQTLYLEGFVSHPVRAIGAKITPRK